jgi:uncharacterized membrane protein YtjA (UPF0391 family)
MWNSRAGELCSNDACADAQQRSNIMGFLGWAAAFFILAVIAAIFGFGGLAAGATLIAEILFFVFIVAFVFTLVGEIVSRSRRSGA